VIVESFTGNNDTQFIFNNFFPENPAVYDIMWKDIGKPDRPQIPI
jgi:hypothetical protein